MPRWALAGAFGTPRLYLKSLLVDRPRGAEGAVRRVAASIALGPDVEPGQPTFSYGLRPLLVYDANINGGLPFDTIDLGPFRFTVDEDTRARQGWTIGARAQAGLDLPVAEGLLMSAFVQLGRRHAPNFGTNITDRSIGACLRHTNDSWSYLDACLSKGDIDNERSKVTSLSRAVTFGQLFDTPQATHEVSLTLMQQTSQGVDQKRLRVASRSMIRDLGAIDAGVSFGEKVDGTLRQTFAADLGYGIILLRRPTRLSVGYAEDTGGTLFGQDRTEQSWSARLSRNVVRNVTAYVSYKDTRSSIPEFSGESWGFGLEYSGFRW